MALIDVRCVHDHIHEVSRSIQAWPATPPCPTCGAATEQTHLPRAIRWQADPVIVFQAPDGSMRFPGDANGLSATNYRKQGFTEIAIRSATEMRRFEKHMNDHERSQASRQLEVREQQRERMEHLNRSDLNALMPGMSRAGRDVARAAIQRTDSRPRRHTSDPGFHSSVYSDDRSNREDSRDSQGRRRRD